jgi:hypothetical protein
MDSIMIETEQRLFDTWWRHNRHRLIAIYNKEFDLNLAVMEMAEFVWKGALDAKDDNTK